MKSMKRLSTFVCSILIILLTLSTPAFAAGTTGNVMDLGDGFYIVEEVNQHSLIRTDNVASGGKTDRVYYGSTLIGTATLWASFDISGSSAKATDAFITGTGNNGGSYVQGTSSYSGNKAYGTAFFRYNGVEKSLRLTLTCSSNGTLS